MTFGVLFVALLSEIILQCKKGQAGGDGLVTDGESRHRLIVSADSALDHSGRIQLVQQGPQFGFLTMKYGLVEVF